MNEVAIPTRRLGALVALQNAKAFGTKDPNRPYVGLEQLASGEPQILGTLPITESVSVNSVFEPGDILFGKLRPNLRKCAAASFAGYCSTDILVLRARQSVSDRFAAHALHSETVFAAAVQSAMGTKMPRTNWAALQSLEVFAPEREIEQTRIAEILDTLDEAIREAEAVIAKLRQVKAGLLHDLLTRGLDEHGHLRDPIRYPEQFQDSPLGLIPKAWSVESFGGLVSDLTLGVPTRGVSAHDENIPLIKMGDFGWGGWTLSDPELIGIAAVSKRPELMLQRDDFLFNTRNTPELVGKTAVWLDQLPKATFDGHAG